MPLCFCPFVTIIAKQALLYALLKEKCQTEITNNYDFSVHGMEWDMPIVLIKKRQSALAREMLFINYHVDDCSFIIK